MVAVVNEQRRDRISSAGLRILQAIETECVKVRDTSERFQRKSKLYKVVFASFASIVVRCRPLPLQAWYTFVKLCSLA